MDAPANLEARKLVVGEGVRTTHMAGTDAEDTNRGLTHAPSITLPSSASSRENQPLSNYSTDYFGNG